MATMLRNMDDLKAPSTSWAEEVRKYEQEKRRCIDEGHVRGTQVRVTAMQVQQQERFFDPVLQRYRDPSLDLQHRVMQEKASIAHLNRAKDTQILREQPFHIIHHASKVEAIAPGMDPERLGGKQRTSLGVGSFPDTVTDYNIISNLPFDVHHWDKPGCRPMVQERDPKPRLVPAHAAKDFDIISNRYTDSHEVRAARDSELNLREAAYKYSEANRYDPLTQQFNDPQVEERARCCDDAREVEASLRFQAGIPPCVRGRLSEHYDLVRHEERDPESLKVWDDLEARRRERFKNRFIMDQAIHAQDLRAEQIQHCRRMNRIAPERYTEAVNRGYDVVTNQTYGSRPLQKNLYKSLARPRMAPWEKAMMGRSLSTPSLPAHPDGLNQSNGSAASGTAESSSAKPLSGSSSAPHLRRRRRQDGEQLFRPGAIASPSALRGGSAARSHGSDRSGSQRSRPSGEQPQVCRQSPTAAPPVAMLGAASHAPVPCSFGGSEGPPPAPRVPGSPIGSAYSRPIAAAA